MLNEINYDKMEFIAELYNDLAGLYEKLGQTTEHI